MKNIIGILTSFASLIVVHLAYAGSATWKSDPVSSDWQDSQNWTPETVPNSPTDIATFGVSNVSPGIHGIELGAMVFSPGASSYFMYVTDLDFYRAGLVDNSGVGQELRLEYGNVVLHNSASAGPASVFYSMDVQSYITFYDGSTAGSARMFVADTEAYFADHSTAGAATFTCGYGGGAVFNTGTSAGTATFTLLGDDYDGRGYINFEGGTANSASFTVNSGSLNGGSLRFEGNSSGGTSSVNLLGYNDTGTGDQRDGTLEIDNHDSPGISIGSLEGSGLVLLGSNNLTVGTNNLSTTFSGTIQDTGSLTRVGIGSLTLTNASTYTRGTIIKSGTVLANNASGSATGPGPVQARAGFFGGGGLVAGAVIIGTASGPGAILGPGATGLVPGTLTIQGRLTLKADATYKAILDSSVPSADQVVARAVAIVGAQVLFNDRSNNVLATGTSFTVINNTATTRIRGTFSNLPDGSTVTIGSNIYQANYEGGDGNNLTLTVL